MNDKTVEQLAREAEKRHGCEWERRFERLEGLGLLRRASTPMGHVAAMTDLAREVLERARKLEEA